MIFKFINSQKKMKKIVYSIKRLILKIMKNINKLIYYFKIYYINKNNYVQKFFFFIININNKESE